MKFSPSDLWFRFSVFYPTSPPNRLIFAKPIAFHDIAHLLALGITTPTKVVTVDTKRARLSRSLRKNTKDHGGAMIHPKLGKPMRAAVGGGKALIPSNAKVAAAGVPIDIPLGHKDEA